MQTAATSTEPLITATITLQEVARALHASGPTVRKWAAELADFPQPVRIGRRLLWITSDVNAYLARQRGEAAHAG